MRKVYRGGTILTMEDDRAKAEMLVTDEDKIVYVGEECETYMQDCDEIIDLQGKCLLPAFIDPHSHFLSFAGSFLQVALNEVASWEDFKQRIVTYIAQNQLRPGEWIQAVGYDQTILPEGEHPTREFLDTLCPDNPLVVQHISGHMGVLNTKAIEGLGITEESMAEYSADIKLEKGFFRESAFVECLKKLPQPGFSTLLAACERAQNIYASYGIATVQEGMMVKEMIPIYQGLLAAKKLKLDVIAYADLKDADAVYTALGQQQFAHFKLGGYKIFLDGSPQGKTAWMRQPYEGTKDCGAQTMTDAQVLAAAKTAAVDHRQLLAHCNGDAACGQFLEALDKIAKQYKNLPETRPVLIHAQLIGKDQLPIAKKVGAIASFFVSHVYHWGDVHLQNFGPERAAHISPARAAMDMDIPVTFHTDTPVIAPDMIEAIDCAVNRTTKDGTILGADEAITVMEALKAVTINAAYQYFEENQKGSLKAGKQADLVILDKNPLEIDQKELKSIRVVETIKAGKTISRIDS